MTKQTDQDFFKQVLGASEESTEQVENSQVNQEQQEGSQVNQEQQEGSQEESSQTNDSEQQMPETEQQEQQQEQQEELSAYDKYARDLGYNSFEDLSNSEASDKIRNFDDIKKNYDTLKQEYDLFLQEVQKTNSNPFAHDIVFKLNHLLKENPDLNPNVATQLLTTDLSSMSTIDKIMLSEKLENPDLSESLLKRKVVKSLGVDRFNDLHDSDLDEGVKMDMQLLESKANKLLSKYKLSDDIKLDESQVNLPDVIKSKLEELQNNSKVDVESIEREWTPVKTHLETNYKEIPLWVDGKDGKPEAYSKLVLNETERKDVANYVMEYVKANNIKQLTDENAPMINNLTYSYVTQKYQSKINKILVDKAKQDEFQRLRNEKDGIRENINPRTNDKSGKGKSKDLMSIFNEKGNIAYKTHRDAFKNN